MKNTPLPPPPKAAQGLHLAQVKPNPYAETSPDVPHSPTLPASSNLSPRSPVASDGPSGSRVSSASGHSLASFASQMPSSGTGNSSGASLGGLETSRRSKKKKSFCSQIVSFFLSSVLAMLAPILFITIIAIINLVIAAEDLVLINTTHDFVASIPPCNVAHMDERDLIGTYVAFGSVVVYAELVEARLRVDACRRQLHEQLATLAEWNSDLFQGPLLQIASESASLSLLRTIIDEKNTTGSSEKEALTSIVQRYADLTLRIDDQLNHPSPHLTRLHTVQTLTNFLGLTRGVGNVIALSRSAPPRILWEQYLTSFFQADAALKESQSVAVPGFEAEWHHPTVATMWSMMELLRTEDGYIEIQKAPTEWWRNTTAGVAELTRYFLELQEKFGVDESVNHLRDELIKLLVGIVVCCVAAVLLGLHQARLRNKMLKQVDTLHEAKRAVAAFVPKSFLATMGYTSITQVTPGNCTETALTMLFADIRRFTTVAEGMGNTELFDWVQAYFARMTGIVESGHGQINMFIGDALFAVFKSARNACLTGVAMHASVEQLNIANRCARNADRKVPVEIGVGIHQDCVALGVLGDENRHTCTLISASVNLASRLEGLTKHLRCRIIVSSTVIDSLTSVEAEEVRYRSLGPAMVKGSGQSSTIYEVFMADDENLQNYKIASKADFEEIVRLFSAADSSDDDNDKHSPTASDGAGGSGAPRSLSRFGFTQSIRVRLQKAADGAEEARTAQSTLGRNITEMVSPRARERRRSAQPPGGSHENSGSGNLSPPAQPNQKSLQRSADESPLDHGTSSLGGESLGETVEGEMGGRKEDDDPDDFAQQHEARVTYQEALEVFFSRKAKGSKAVRRSLMALLDKQKEFHVTDETFYRLLIFHQGKAGMVFGSK